MGSTIEYARCVVDIAIGSRTPVKAPAWATLEVAHGGFTTGRLLALLEDGDVRTRVAIARSVSSRADGTRIVRRALGDEGPIVRVAAADAALGLAP